MTQNQMIRRFVDYTANKVAEKRDERRLKDQAVHISEAIANARKHCQKKDTNYNIIFEKHLENSKKTQAKLNKKTETILKELFP